MRARIETQEPQLAITQSEFGDARIIERAHEPEDLLIRQSERCPDSNRNRRRRGEDRDPFTFVSAEEITLRFDPRMLARIKRIARSRYLNYQSMIKQWLSERLEKETS